jgi:hypothetical protein
MILSHATWLNGLNITPEIPNFKRKLTQDNPPNARDALGSAIYDATDF